MKEEFPVAELKDRLASPAYPAGASNETSPSERVGNPELDRRLSHQKDGFVKLS